jgi:hypothetical protein
MYKSRIPHELVLKILEAHEKHPEWSGQNIKDELAVPLDRATINRLIRTGVRRMVPRKFFEPVDGECPMCGRSLVGRMRYGGRFMRNFFGFRRGFRIRDLCGDCYCLLFREFLIDRGGTHANIFRGWSNVCDGCELQKGMNVGTDAIANDCPARPDAQKEA